MGKYTLVNPSIEGSFKKTCKGKNSLEAANIMYEKLSKNFLNNMPKFVFTLTKDNKYYHFMVSEKINNKDIKYSIKNYDKHIDDSILADIFSKNKELKGGKSNLKVYSDSDFDSDINEDDSLSDEDSSSSSSSIGNDYYLYKPVSSRQSITYWTYYPRIYTTTNLYIPTFIPILNPYVNISLIGPI